MTQKKTAPLGDKIKGAVKSFYDGCSPKEACDWLEGFVEHNAVTSKSLCECIEEYEEKGRAEVDATIVGAIARLIDTVREVLREKEDFR